jgi:hypothetical protein
MRIANNAVRSDAEETQHVVKSALEGLLSLESPHVADMLAKVGEVALGNAERGFQFCAYGKHGADFVRQFNGEWRISPGSAQRHLAAFEGADDGIVADHLDVAIVGKEDIGDVGQAGLGFVVVTDDRFAGRIGRGHHKGLVTHQQMVQRRVRQHHADVAVTGRNLPGERSMG